METRRLANFIAVIDYGSLTRAAERMHIAQPALSQQIALMEAAFGTKLLVRKRTGVTATSAGMALYRNAQTILRQMKQLEADVGAAELSVSGHVGVGIPVSCAGIISLPLLQAVRERYPNILLHLSENLSGLLGELMVNNRLDIAMLYGTHGSEGLTRTNLLVERLCLVAAPAFLPGASTAETVQVAELASVPLVLPSHSNGLRALVDVAMSRHGLKPDIIAELDSLPSLRAAAAAGFAATILPRSAIEPDTKNIVVREIVEPSIERTIVICRPGSSGGPTPVDTVEEILISTIDRLVESGEWRGVTRV